MSVNGRSQPVIDDRTDRVSFRSNGTPRTPKASLFRFCNPILGSSVRMSGIWTAAPARTARPDIWPRFTGIGYACKEKLRCYHQSCDGAATCNRPPSGRNSAPIRASHRRTADSSSVSSTVCRSKVDRLIALSTSAVAVCCCKDSRNSSEQPRVLDRDDCLCGEVLD